MSKPEDILLVLSVMSGWPKWRLILSCLVLSCLVWSKINHSWSCFWLCAIFVVIGLHSVIEEFSICIYVQSLKWTFIFVRGRVLLKIAKYPDDVKKDKNRQDMARRDDIQKMYIYIHIHTQTRLFIRKSQHFRIQQQPTSRHGSNFGWKIFHNKEFWGLCTRLFSEYSSNFPEKFSCLDFFQVEP